jgi:outer membrane protein OmpA-like peptidoglycan-associated protein
MILARSSLAVAAFALFGTAACEMTDPSNPNRNTQTGAVVGAGIGALLGASTGGDDTAARRRNAILGAAIGGGLGAVGGRQLDLQEAELRQQLGNQSSIVNTGNQLIVTMPQDILFATDSATLRPTLVSDLRDVGRSLLSYPNTTAQVIGHTDSDGDASYNLALSERRAQAVANVLLSEGVPGYRLRVVGRGEDQPIASNLTPAGKAQNRRVEIVILPNA